MTKAHRDEVLELAPHRLHRTFTLIEAARLVFELDARNVAELAELRPHLAKVEPSDIPDPIGQGTDVFEAVGSQVDRLIPSILRLCPRN